MADTTAMGRSDAVSLGWFLRVIARHRWLFAEILVIAIAARALDLFIPFAFQALIDRVLPFQREASLTVIAALIVFFTGFQVVFNVLRTVAVSVVSNRIVLDLNRHLYDHILRLPQETLQRWNIGQIVSRIDETDRVRAFVVTALTGTLLDLVFAVLVFSLLIGMAPSLAIFVLCLIPIQLIGLIVIGPFLRRRLHTQFDAAAIRNASEIELLGETTTLKSLGAETRASQALSERTSTELTAQYDSGIIRLVSAQFIFATERITTVVILFVGGGLVLDGSMTLGQLVAFYILTERSLPAVRSVVALWEGWQDVRVARGRISEMLDTPTEDAGTGRKTLQVPDGVLRCEGVGFAYGDGPMVLSELDATFTGGQVNLVIGPSGVGKTTLAHLLAGLSVPTYGKVTLDGTALSDIAPAARHPTIGYVPVSAPVFSGTVAENLMIGAPQADRTALAAVLARVGLANVFDRLPDGIDTRLGHGGHVLSQGQAQRLALARALLTDPKVLILDEPTGTLDAASAKQIARTLSRFARTRTVVVFTHQPEYFPDAQQALSLTAPEPDGDGSHVLDLHGEGRR